MERSEELRSDVGTPFFLSSPDETMVASGVARVWDSSLAGGLAQQVEDGLRGSGGERVAVGAIPFHPRHAAYLVEPRELLRVPNEVAAASGRLGLPPVPPPRSPLVWSDEAADSRRGYEQCVGNALKLIGGGASLGQELRKVVLARSLLLHTPEPVDAAVLLDRLRADPGVVVFSVPLPSPVAGGRVLVGATPELLLDKSGRRITSHPLAGSVRRHADAAADSAVAQSLLRSEKDRLEHALVVEYIADVLAPYCRHLEVPSAPALVSTETMWHLGTRVTGELRDPEVSSLELLAGLHPTPAVCGFPADRAASVIAELEPFDRGFYGGAVGWCDADGDGRWHLSIRCAEVTRDSVRLFAGAGIVEGSDPGSEAAETSAKLRAMLTALGIEEEEEADSGAAREAK